MPDAETPSRAPRAQNTRRVLDALQRKTSATQGELVEDTRLSRGTVESIVARLRDEDLVEAVPSRNGHARPEGGRPAHSIQFREDAAIALSIDFGLKHVYVARGSLSGVTRHLETDHDIDIAHNAPLALETAVDLVGGIMDGLSPSDLVGVCVGLPAPIDQLRGQIATTRGITSWTGLRPADELRYRLGPDWEDVPFIMENDTNLIALAELNFGAAKPVTSSLQDVVIVLKWSDGVGAGLLVDGDLIVGHRGVALEFGHTCIPSPPSDIKATRCDRCGHICLERFAGGEALTHRLRRSDDDDIDFGDVICRAVATNGHERTELKRAAEHIGEALGSFATLVNPRLVVISGRHFGEAPNDLAAYRLVADALRTGMHKTGSPTALEDVAIALGERSALAAADGGVVAVLRSSLPKYLESRLVLD
ncbi:MAG TPA: ROK family transcriptional regulator [Solirubrobacteraceae bacterium]|jgi:predicted NBD/HSP70 family sugar kinase|nr:ROK family transcriptional regulator [Solirubrobacteraceae bacterium]